MTKENISKTHTLRGRTLHEIRASSSNQQPEIPATKTSPLLNTTMPFFLQLPVGPLGGHFRVPSGTNTSNQNQSSAKHHYAIFSPAPCGPPWGPLSGPQWHKYQQPKPVLC